MRRYVKYMVSLRCKMIVKDELKNAGIKFSITPHEAIEFHQDLSRKQLDNLDRRFKKSGLELLNEQKSLLIERIINTIQELIHDAEKLPDLSFEEVISGDLVTDNEKILQIFSDVKGLSIIQYIITQKIERIKELILYQDKSLPKIAEMLRYRNVDLMISQFKKHTGLNPYYFRTLKDKRNRTRSESPSTSG